MKGHTIELSTDVYRTVSCQLPPASWVLPSNLGMQSSTVQGGRLQLYGCLDDKDKPCLLNYACPFFHYNMTMLEVS